MANESNMSVTSGSSVVTPSPRHPVTPSPHHPVTPSQCNDLPFAGFVEQARALPVDVAIVLGSGMSELADRCHIASRLPFAEVPGLSATSVAGHSGCLILGAWGGKRILLFEGRLHYYEGHPWRSVTEPIQIAHFLGARIVLLTNAAGGIHDALAPGSLMAIRDHIEWTRPYCWQQADRGCALATPYSAR